jgi:hypothetical protein
MQIVGTPPETEKRLAGIVHALQTDLDDGNCRSAGFLPFGRAFACDEVLVEAAAGYTANLVLTHHLVDGAGRKLIPDRWVVVDKAGDGDISRSPAPWSDSVAVFSVAAITDCTWRIVLYRSAE